ncbi:ParA/MinD ATPase-like protein [Natrialba hulunbeirensis JCM 10989]|uniref:ParA/MinD ATPase-like protein n=1 Tax=Natrialba hulunbeirensis JCM 10989 TaxID=1227493 RepID=M0A0M5_9EURY|nr:P-loop NTPase [Natrialba hulunbeirensis]ELY91881.1 ParA/MinD ATPase-like protein [Natrialba hulunbeirensis JCM 10989]
MGYETPATDDEIKTAVIDRTREVAIADGDPVSEQLLEDVCVEDGVVTFTVAFERLNRTLSERLTEQLRGAGLATTGVEHVRVEAADADAPESGLPVTGVGSLIAVGSAKGGVGKTTVTAALARALDESGLDVAVFDANVYAPDVPDLLGAAGPVQTTPTGRPEPVVADGIEVVSMELIADDGPVAWRGAMVHDVLKDLLGNAPWSDRDVLLVDLPPGIGDAVYTIVQQAPLDGALLVSTPTDAGARATERTGALFTANDVDTIGVVPNMVAPEDTDNGSDSDGDSEVAGPFDATGDDLPDEIQEDASETIDPIPFDPALRDPTTSSFANPSTPGEAAIAKLADAVAAFAAGDDGPQVPDDAVDLRGLPAETAAQQTLTELALRDEFGVLLRHDPDELITTLEDSLGSATPTLTRANVVDLERDGWLVELQFDHDSTAVSESPA